jgi:hypothetical protein
VNERAFVDKNVKLISARTYADIAFKRDEKP